MGQILPSFDRIICHLSSPHALRFKSLKPLLSAISSSTPRLSPLALRLPPPVLPPRASRITLHAFSPPASNPINM